MGHISGRRGGRLLVSEPVGPAWLSGGTFGPEASAVTVAVMLVCTAGLAVLLVRRGLVVAPIWERRRRAAATPLGSDARPGPAPRLDRAPLAPAPKSERPAGRTPYVRSR